MSEDAAAIGDFEAAFDCLFPPAFHLARRIVGDEATAEDVAAEALARAYARWSGVAELPDRDAWVLRVAANLAIDQTRRRFPLGTVAPSLDPDDATTLRLALSAGLRSPPRRQRQAVALRYLAGLSDSDGGRRHGIPIGSVKTHLHPGRAALRAAFGPNVDLEVTPVGME